MVACATGRARTLTRRASGTDRTPVLIRTYPLIVVVARHFVAVRTEPADQAEHLSAYLRGADELAAGFRRQAASAETLRAYQGDWARIERWCAVHELVPLPFSPKRKAPVLLADLEAMLGTFEVTTWPTAVAGTRNRCLLLFGWAGALRMSELVG
jgi:integrase